MKPAALGYDAFDLVIAPVHDHLPNHRKIVETQGALNLITPEYLDGCRNELLSAYPQLADKMVIGCLLGGDTRDFKFDPEKIKQVLRQLQDAARKIDAVLAVTTSRRTSAAVEEVVRQELQGKPCCPFLIIASSNNVPYAVGGILAVSSLVVISPESISMVSEAVTSGKYVVVFDAAGLKMKFQEFLAIFSRKQYISLIDQEDLSAAILNIWYNKPHRPQIVDRQIVSEAVAKVL
jgi:mitochondrial fission protein ELM1